jgi:hypothetical protein
VIENGLVSEAFRFQEDCAAALVPGQWRAPFVIPGTTIRFGLDGIIGLIPLACEIIETLSRPT